MRGRFITFEGGEGSGKSTQIGRLAATLEAAGVRVVTTREPGGSPGAEALRHIILSGAAKRLGAEMEAILFAAARADHVSGLIKPSIERGDVVLCDRFHDSTRVYQGLSGGVDPELLDTLEEAALQGIYPDLTFILDVPAELGLRRAAARRGDGAPDRFEEESLDVQERRREAFLAIAAEEPERCHVVDASQAAEQVADEIAVVALSRLALDQLVAASEEEVMPPGASERPSS